MRTSDARDRGRMAQGSRDRRRSWYVAVDAIHPAPTRARILPDASQAPHQRRSRQPCLNNRDHDRAGTVAFRRLVRTRATNVAIERAAAGVVRDDHASMADPGPLPVAGSSVTLPDGASALTITSEPGRATPTPPNKSSHATPFPSPSKLFGSLGSA